MECLLMVLMFVFVAVWIWSLLTLKALSIVEQIVTEIEAASTEDELSAVYSKVLDFQCKWQSHPACVKFAPRLFSVIDTKMATILMDKNLIEMKKLYTEEP